ncbi:MAG: type 1 glutamine amidotransferase [Erysipelotrichales bacterium]|nr:type 1 glutamine amidotransferase [Erysipelotrichales bacterium]
MYKKIGITVRVTKDKTVWKQFVNSPYLEAMEKYKLIPIILPVEEESYKELFSLCDGFIIAGGADIDPKYYNEEITLSTGIEEKMDLLDKAVYEFAVKNKKPLFGICRGLQVINVFAGGSLYQDLGIKNEVHQDKPLGHLINLEKNILFKDFKENKVQVNSYHHQAIKDLAPDYYIDATSEDNVIEAISHKTLPIVAFQWHPERDDTPINDYVFQYFISLLS